MLRRKISRGIVRDTRFYILVLLSLFAASVIVSCGDSGGGGKGPDTNIAPIAIIKMTPEVPVPGEKVFLSASDSSDADAEVGDIFSYAWKQTGGPVLTLEDADQPVASFVAPNINTNIGIQLIVTDAEGNPSLPVSITITVSTTGGPGGVNAIYVSSTSGSDNSSRSGSHEEPVATIGRGIELANEVSADTVYVISGTYEEEVIPSSDINLVGSVTGANDDGTPIFGTGAGAETKVLAPGTSTEALSLENVSNVTVKGFSIQGTRDTVCSDVYIKGGTNITLSSNSFSGGEDCEKYTAVTIEDSDQVKVISETETTTFTIVSTSSESDITAVEVLNSDNVEISGVSVETGGSPLHELTVFSGFVLSEVANAVVSENSISALGTDSSNGISVTCKDSSSTVTIEHNVIEILDVAGDENGIKIVCPKSGSSFDIKRNKITLKPKAYKVAKLHGVDATVLFRDVDLSVVNNIVTMPVVTEPSGDLSDKTGLHMSMFGSSSEVSILHNTFLLSGNMGKLFAVHSDVDDLAFTTTNNIVLVFGSNASNAIFSLRDSCGSSGCSKTVRSNLLSSKFYASDIPLIYQYDTGDKIGMSSVSALNELEFITPSHFDMDQGEVKTNYQNLVKNLGFKFAGISTDIDGKSRDSSPDIGATEY